MQTWSKLLMLFALSAFAGPATAQSSVPPELTNPKIVVVYGSPDGKPEALNWLKDRKILERIAQFLSPVNLPATLTLTSGGPATKVGCPEASPNMYFNPGANELVVCYAYIDWWRSHVARNETFRGITSQDVLAGGFAGVILHEAGHALSSMLGLTVLGREEDAADQIAALIMLQFSPDLSRAALKGFAYTLLKLGEGDPAEAAYFFDVHGTPSQRFYNTICIAYGKDPDGYRDVVELAQVPKARLDNCKYEYAQVKKAFERTILPHLDAEKVAKVRAVDWIALGGS
jgi:hypothetical protein